MVETLDVNTMLANEFEPKRQFRWILGIDGLDAFTAKTAARPKKDQQEIVIDFINQKRFLAGKGEWMPIDIELHDPIAPSQAQKVMDWLRLVHDSDVGRMGYAAVYKKNFVLKLLDGGGMVVEKWSCQGAWPKNIDWGALDFANNETLTVKFTLRADNWSLQF